jgi:hypothetical protein
MPTDRRAEADDLYVEISAPDCELWTSGPEDAPQRVSGSALEATGEGAVHGQAGLTS